MEEAHPGGARRPDALALPGDQRAAVSSPPAMPMKRPKRPKPASRARAAAINIPASAIPPSPCSRSAWRSWKAHPSARATATGMAAVTAVFLSAPQDRRPCRGRQGDVRFLPLCDGESPAALRHHHDLRGRRRSRTRGQAAMRPQTKLLFLETPSNPTLAIVDIEGGGENRRKRRRAAWWWTTPSPARPCSGRWSSARISWCIPPPNISTARAARWAA